MNEPQVFAPKRRGRPRGTVQRNSVSTWVESTIHDRLIQLAASERKSVSALVEQLLVLQIRRVTK